MMQAAVLGLLIGLVLLPSVNSVTYTPDLTGNFSNPERGWYHHQETHLSNDSPLDEAELRDFRLKESVTLILRIFYLDAFRTSAISQNYLDSMTQDFNKVRNAGLKALLRFAYTDQDSTVPYGDTTVSRTLQHVGQLKPVLQAHEDVIAAVQFGFVGAWGEWYYTDYWGFPPNNTDWANRRQLLTALMDAVPASRQIQTRTPGYKTQLVQMSAALAAADAHKGTTRSRLGHHNDCFLASSSDFGTYTNVGTEYPYLSAETKYTVMGGETCQVNAPRSTCPTAQQEMAMFHWSYINADYHLSVIGSWKTGQCHQNITARLGYRLELVSGQFPELVPGGKLNFTLVIRNVGYAAPYNARLVRLILKPIGGGSATAQLISLSDCPQCDPRFWLPGEHTLDIRTSLTVANGNYSLHLHLADPATSLRDRPEYSIRLANKNIWDPATGYHSLGAQIAVVPGPPSPLSGGNVAQAGLATVLLSVISLLVLLVL